jgi:hypothetical protein
MSGYYFHVFIFTVGQLESPRNDDGDLSVHPFVGISWSNICRQFMGFLIRGILQKWRKGTFSWLEVEGICLLL